jgi:uncharacterized protein involved in response to NO
VTRGPFAYGFRTFFLAAGLSALALVPWWAAATCCGVLLTTAWPGSLWHGHEMLHGFVAAAIAGFLLTAVPSWTRRRGFGGAPLVFMSLVWLLGRVAAAASGHLHPAVVAAADLAFLPVLAAWLGPPLVRERNRNTPLLAVLGVLWAANASFHLALWRGDAVVASTSLLVTVDVVILLITVIGGRITPAFTATALRLQGVAATVRAARPMAPLAVGAMILVAMVDAFAGGGRLAGWTALLAAAVQFARLAQWQGHRTLGDTLVWILHLGYLWIPLGLLLKGMALLGVAGVALGWLHALTAGAVATMILGVMTRVSLGHTGRPLVLPAGVVLAYLSLAGAAVLRVLGPVLTHYCWTLAAAAVLWALAFTLFLWRYGPILWRPRPDGRPG